MRQFEHKGFSTMRSLMFLFLGLSLLCGLVGGAAHAQERNPFFDRDFARNPLDEGGTSGGAPSKRTPQPKDKDNVVESPSETEESETKAEATPSEGDSMEAPDLTALTKTHKVLAIGGIINAVEKNHFEERMRELLEVVDRYDFNVGFVWAIGSVQNIISSKEVLFLAARQALIEAAEEPPAQYKVKMSPTWIVRTPEGEILLEATGPLVANFNMKGEFIERVSEMRVGTPVVKPTGESPADLPATPTPVPSPTPDQLFGGAQPQL